MTTKNNPDTSRRPEAHGADEGTLGGVTAAVKDKVGDVASSVASTAEDAWDSTREGVRRAAHATGDAWDEMTGLMRRYPFGTLCVGIGVGFLLSRALDERRTGDLHRIASDLYDRARDYASEAASKLRA